MAGCGCFGLQSACWWEVVGVRERRMQLLMVIVMWWVVIEWALTGDGIILCGRG